MSDPSLASAHSLFDLARDCGDRLAAVHRTQIRREPWPDFEGFERERYPLELRREAAEQWAGRARAEHGSIHQFSQIAHALATARAPLVLLGALARLITDEVRHAELCFAMAVACEPELSPGPASWPALTTPWKPPPPDADDAALLAWASRAILIACCIGETISRPMLDAIATVATDPVAEGCARQILRDEHLHATFGWEALAHLVPRLGAAERELLQETLRTSLAGFEQSTACGVSVAELAGTELEISRDPTTPNLGLLTPTQYAAIFYSTLETEVFPKLVELGLDPVDAWARRGEAIPEG
ncbi:MAG: hypothetical protein JKY65_32950 [Planctomycetes bacterium]|nr:hypothetical protein [Planctomycetota bacterium]